jgi:hypothetical protein
VLGEGIQIRDAVHHLCDPLGRSQVRAAWGRGQGSLPGCLEALGGAGDLVRVWVGYNYRTVRIARTHAVVHGRSRSLGWISYLSKPDLNKMELTPHLRYSNQVHLDCTEDYKDKNEPCKDGKTAFHRLWVVKGFQTGHTHV